MQEIKSKTTEITEKYIPLEEAATATATATTTASASAPVAAT